MSGSSDPPHATPASSAPIKRSLKGDLSRTLSLALPVMLGRAGMFIVFTVDTVMTGRAGASELAAYGISMALHVPLLVIGIGCLSGVVVLVARADGAGRPTECGAVWRMALILALVLGGLVALPMQFSEGLLLALGQNPGVATDGARALAWTAPGMPAIYLFIATSFFLEGIGRPTPGMVISLAANLVNLALNWLLIEGNLGAPAMGAAGATLATSATRWVMAAAIVIYVLRLAAGAHLGIRLPIEAKGELLRRLLRIGAPLSLANAFETLAFSSVAIFAGWLGEIPLAGYQAAMNVVTLVFMMSLGIMIAASVRVANAVGRDDRPGIARAGWTGFLLVASLMLALGLVIWLGRSWIAAFYSENEAVRAVAASGLAVVAVLVVVDGIQAVMLGALRGVGDAMIPTAMYLFSFWAVAVPLAWWLGVESGLAVPGLFVGLLMGLFSAALLLCLRFRVVSRRPIRHF